MRKQQYPHKAILLTVGTTVNPIIYSLKAAVAGSQYPLDVYLIYGRSVQGQTQPHPVDVAKEAEIMMCGEVNSITLLEIEDPEDLDCCLKTCEKALVSIKQDETVETIVNITGGTKAMAGALTLAACQNNPLGLVFEYVGGARAKLNGRVTGEMIRREFKNTALEHNYKLIKEHIKKCNYAQAIALCNLLPSTAHVKTLRRCIESLILWDNFEYKAALSRIPGITGLNLLKDDSIFSGLASLMERLNKCEPIKQVVGDIKQCENKQGDPAQFSNRYKDEPLLLIADILENANRRLIEQKYVDVAMRSYRCIEASIQLCLLKKWGINAWQLNEKQVPNCPAYLSRINRLSLPTELALNNGFDLIQHLNGNFLPSLINDFRYVQQIRNHCHIEHGYSEVTADKARQCIPKAKSISLALLNCIGYNEENFNAACEAVRHIIID